MKSRITISNRFVFLGDLALIAVSVFGSFGLRLEFGGLFLYYLPQAFMMLVLALMIKPAVFWKFGLYRRVWAYASTRELMLIMAGVTTSSVFLSLGVILITTLQQATLSFYRGFPRGTLVIDWLLTLVLVGGFRFALRLLAESQTQTAPVRGRTRRVLIVGAGDAGALVVRELQKNPQMNMQPVCFVDDDPAKQKQRIHDVPVSGTLNDISRLIDFRSIDEVVIAIPSAAGDVLRRVLEVCQRKGVTSRTMPGIYELIGGKVSVNRLREVEISDLLRRAPATIDNERVGTILTGKRVMVSGAGGSIGRELCRQISRWRPSELILLGHGENSIFGILDELQESFAGLPISPVIADVRDLERMENVFEAHRPQLVFHAAAHKHVPLMEVNIEEAVTNNILGTRNLVELALNYDAERMIMVSTDKAVSPSSVMGATKRMAELLVLDAAHRSGREFSVVRFGNVLGSRGSVVPYFKRQIARGGPVTVTHPEMKRYFMTIPEAVHLTLQAMANGQGGEVFVLRMGEQVRITDLAEDLIRLSGLEPGVDINIVYTGIRPGEKLSEELWDKWAQYEPTSHPDIVRLADEDVLSGKPLMSVVDDLIHLAREGEPAAIVRILDEMIPGAAVRSTPPPDMTSFI
ncbi:MAG: polysaccharide biosynthesis protein [Anaerolineales bacterium]|jgi:FlaA1/EpsC-like NDP-sugar epimerase